MGGGVMRTAAKVAGVGAGVAGSGLRGVPAARPVEQPVAATAWKAAASAPVSSVISSSNAGEASVAVPRPSWELDDWEFASVEAVIDAGTGKALPRVVFGGVPSFQEAKEATSELKDALDQLYLAPSRSTACGVQQGLIQFPSSDHLETKSCIAATENTVAVAPAHAIQAFTFLKETPAAQSVVASIASDPNVWTAVMQNKELVEFLQKSCNFSGAPYPQASKGLHMNTEESVGETGFEESSVVGAGDSGSEFQQHVTPRIFEESFDAAVDAAVDAGSWTSWLQSLFESMKFSLADLVGNIFGVPAEKTSSPYSNEKAEGGASSMNIMNIGVGASLTGLAVMVILMVVMKRA